ncbi:MAG: response regulator [Deltaproteobacteria bacterium]|nr:response regulator [Deltaproteobacteria bacterium]
MNSPSFKSILIVDDEEVILELLQAIFGNQYQVYQATNGDDALRIYKLQSPNLLISDLCMPGLNGLELIRTVKNDGACKVFAVSGQEDAFLEQARLAGADEVLPKPLDIRRLLKLAGKYLTPPQMIM